MSADVGYTRPEPHAGYWRWASRWIESLNGRRAEGWCSQERLFEKIESRVGFLKGHEGKVAQLRLVTEEGGCYADKKTYLQLVR